MEIRFCKSEAIFFRNSQAYCIHAVSRGAAAAPTAFIVLSFNFFSFFVVIKRSIYRNEIYEQ